MCGFHEKFINIIWMILMAITLTQEQKCGIAEEGKVYTLSLVIPPGSYKDEDVHIEANHGRIARCTLRTQTCINLHSNLYHTNLKKVEGSSVINVTVYNMTKTRFLSNDIVQFSYAFANDYQKQEMCEPKVFFRPRDIVCLHQITGEGLSLTCTAERIYPGGKCFFLLSFNREMSTIHSTSTSESIEELAEMPIYFKFNCNIFISKSTLVPALYHFNLSMYPSIYHSNTDVMYGTNDSLAIILDHPKLILENCPEYIEENKEVQCTCLNIDTSPINVFINWFTKDGQTVLGNAKSNVLKVKAKRIAQ
ncbi:unnamed protein product, partial [Lymnaea stagnalis]